MFRSRSLFLSVLSITSLAVVQSHQASNASSFRFSDYSPFQLSSLSCASPPPPPSGPTFSEDDEECAWCREMRKGPCKEFESWHSCVKDLKSRQRQWEKQHPNASTAEIESAKKSFDFYVHCKDLFMALHRCINQHKHEYVGLIFKPGNNESSEQKKEDNENSKRASEQSRTKQNVATATGIPVKDDEDDDNDAVLEKLPQPDEDEQ